MVNKLKVALFGAIFYTVVAICLGAFLYAGFWDALLWFVGG